MRLSKYLTFLVLNLLIMGTLFAVWTQNEKAFEEQRELSEEMLVEEALSHFENLVNTRTWNARHGGVFVKPQPGQAPNPYLKDNHLFTADGEMLIKVNPAWMTRQISEISNASSKSFYKITSLKPLNPSNRPDTFETEALQYFETHPDSQYYYHLSDDMQEFDFMGPLKVQPSCMPCHAQQGYQVGDIRGGIRVSLPTAAYQEKLQILGDNMDWSQQVVLLFGLGTMLLVNLGLIRIYRHQEEVERFNQTLEQRVHERTREIHEMYRHEKHLREILKTIADVNALLVSSLSVQNVLKSSIDRLSEHEDYHYIWIGMVNQSMLDVSYASKDAAAMIGQSVLGLEEEYDNPFLNGAFSALTLNHTVLEKIDLHESGAYLENSELPQIHWFIAIPLKNADESEALGVLNVYTTHEKGFEVEEVNMLENLATDISLALQSIIQRTVLEKMEMEKIANFEETILAFVNIIEQRDSYTAGHTLRVARYCRVIAEAMHIDDEEIVRLEKAAILHDIGKVATPDAILLKPGRLQPLEYELIKQHAEAGYNMLSKIEMYKELAEIIRYHHARYDGKGYPKTPDPQKVPFLSFVMALADAFDAMTSNRIYKPRKSVNEALEEIRSFSGTQFHPRVAEAALKALETIRLEDTHQLPENQLEQKRFSYFFQDALTELYNESYLQVLLADENREFNILHLLDLQNFSSFNKSRGWHEGDHFLQAFAKHLEKLYPDSLIFRFHGDDFVLMSSTKLEIDPDVLNGFEFVKSSQVSVRHSRYILESRVYSIDEIKPLTEL
jgi:putative nucleotidyltransferase with HDIG domain